PAFALLGYRGVIGLLIVMSAAAAAIGWLVAWSVSGDAVAAWFAWAGVVLSAPYFVHSSAIYPDGASAIFTIAGMVPLVLPRAREPRWLLPIGLALGLLPWLHTRFVLLAVGFGIAIAARLVAESNPKPRLIAFAAAPLLCAAAWLGFFKLIYGTPDPT